MEQLVRTSVQMARSSTYALAKGRVLWLAGWLVGCADRGSCGGRSRVRVRVGARVVSIAPTVNVLHNLDDQAHGAVGRS
jgi:hypothetical protein